MILNRCEVVFNDEDGRRNTRIVYGPTPDEYEDKHPIGSWVDGRGFVREVRRVRQKYLEEASRFRRAWWERESRPTHYFFTQHLSRDGVVGGSRTDHVLASDGVRSEDSGVQGEVAEGRSGDDHGD